MEELLLNTQHFQFFNTGENKKIVLNGTSRLLESTDIEDLKNASPDFWWTENDYITFLSFLPDGPVVCERKKKIFDYRIREYKELVYQFDVADTSKVEEIRKVILNKYEELQIKYYREKKELIKASVAESLGYINISLNSLRKSLLSISDYMFINDYVWKTDSDREYWVKYRQYLRDITETEEWKSGDFLKIKFPISPNEYKKLYPDGDVPYLDKIYVDNKQFVNKAIATWKVKLLRNLASLQIPSAMEEVNTYISKNDNDYDVDYENYQIMLRDLTENLQRIDATITINEATVAESSQFSDDCPDCTLQ